MAALELQFQNGVQDDASSTSSAEAYVEALVERSRQPPPAARVEDAGLANSTARLGTWGKPTNGRRSLTTAPVINGRHQTHGSTSTTPVMKLHKSVAGSTITQIKPGEVYLQTSHWTGSVGLTSSTASSTTLERILEKSCGS